MRQDKLNKILQKPIFLVLLTVFFVLHGYTENFDVIPVADSLYLLGVYIAASILVCWLFWLFYHDVGKSAIMSFAIMAFQFFFGSLQDTLKAGFAQGFFSRYSFLLPFFLVVFLLIIVGLRRRKNGVARVSAYLNVLFALLILIDLVWLADKALSTYDRNRPTSSHNIASCDTCARPDIYFLLFDEYSSSTALRELWNYDNDDLDNFLRQKGFSIQAYSRSNYNFTPFSIASTLNMDYLDIPNPRACTVKDYSACVSSIRNNRICSMLEALGYEIVNYSIFDLDKNPSPVVEDFLPLKTKLITSQTFLSRIRKDLFYHLLTGKFEIPWLSSDLIYTTYHNNEKIINATLKESMSVSVKPKFVYSHIEMPHPPFYYSQDRKQTDRNVLVEENNKLSPSSYLGYLPKTNLVIKQLVNSIITNAKRPVVIILMGDHGFRTRQPEPYHFRNQNAVYTSFSTDNWFDPNISNVNEFRVLSNHLFQTSFSLLKDSTVFLRDK